jgi:hypothetical protein
MSVVFGITAVEFKTNGPLLEAGKGFYGYAGFYNPRESTLPVPFG